MNNKKLARIVAAVMAVAMLGTVSFAASLTGDEITVVDANKPDGYDAQAKKTGIAFYAVNPDADTIPAAEDIVAVFQDDSVAANTVDSGIKIDAPKAIADGNTHLVIRLGGVNGTVKDTYLALTGGDLADFADIKAEYVVGENTYSNVAVLEKTVTPASAITSYGFKVWKTDEAGTTTSENPYYFISNDTEFAGGGTYTYGIILLGVDGATLSAQAYTN